MQKVLYAGSFDPITNGHLDVIKRGSKFSETLIVAVLENLNKNSKYTIDQRIKMVELACKNIDNVSVISFNGLLADYIDKNEIDILLRGLRAGADFEYEISIAQFNKKLFKTKAEVIFLMTDPKNSFISSSLIKEVFSLGGDIKNFVPKEVLEYMTEIERKNN